MTPKLESWDLCLYPIKNPHWRVEWPLDLSLETCVFTLSKTLIEEWNDPYTFVLRPVYLPYQKPSLESGMTPRLESWDLCLYPIKNPHWRVEWPLYFSLETCVFTLSKTLIGEWNESWDLCLYPIKNPHWRVEWPLDLRPVYLPYQTNQY